MRIDEVVKLVELSRGGADQLIKRKFASYEEFSKYLDQKYQLEPLGAGSYARVYVARRRTPVDFMLRDVPVPSDFVLKIGRDDIGERDRQSKFVPVARAKFPTNKLFPMIYAHFELPRANGHPIDVTIQEYVEVLPSSKAATTIAAAADQIYDIYKEWGTNGPDPDQAEEEYYEYQDLISDLEDYGITEEDWADLHETLYFSGPFDFDIHKDNIGFRRDGSITIFDPIV